MTTGRRMTIQDLPNSKRTELIDEWLHSETDRTVAKRSLIDGISVERIAEEIDRSPRQTARILSRVKQELMKHI